MIDCHTGDWAREMVAELGLPTKILGPITSPATAIGKLRSIIAEETGLPPGLQVVAPGTHDTASAVAAVPAKADSNWCYLSSGTWSLLGAELDEPCVSAAAQAGSFTNELGVGGTIRFLKNIAGLWLVQECRRDFARRGQEFDYPTLTQLASEAPAFRTLVDPGHSSFLLPGDMPQKIAEFARATGQPAPESPGQFIRCCLESLALAYRDKLSTLESILESAIRCAAYRRRRRKECAAFADDCRCNWPAGRRWSVRGDSHGQRSGAGDGDEPGARYRPLAANRCWLVRALSRALQAGYRGVRFGTVACVRQLMRGAVYRPVNAVIST